MKKFWKIYSWIYFIFAMCAIITNFLNPIEINTKLTPTQHIIVYSLASLLWLIPVLGVFMYAYNIRKIIFFWRIYTVYFAYAVIITGTKIFTDGDFFGITVFHTIALLGLFLYAFRINRDSDHFCKRK